MQDKISLAGDLGSGKSTVGKVLSEITGKLMVDTDEMVVKDARCEIGEIFARQGERVFRDMETEAVKTAAAMTGIIIATGGGAILRKENVDALRENGKLYFLDRPLDELMPTESRPLASDRAAIEKRYNERYGIYASVCDERIAVDACPEKIAERIIGKTR